MIGRAVVAHDTVDGDVAADGGATIVPSTLLASLPSFFLFFSSLFLSSFCASEVLTEARNVPKPISSGGAAIFFFSRKKKLLGEWGRFGWVEGNRLRIG